MHFCHVMRQILLGFRTRNIVHILQETLGNGDQRVFGPLMEPVDGSARDDTRELTSTLPERISHRTEA